MGSVVSNEEPEPKPVSAAPRGPARRLAPDNSAALTPTIFHEKFWLEAASAGCFEESQVTENGQCIGRLPYLLDRRSGLSSIQMPMLTHFLGPAIDDGRGSETTRLIKRISIAKALIARLPATHSLWLKCHRATTDTLAFQDAGFLTVVQFTGEIGPDTEDRLWAGMRDTARNVIRRAAERLTVVDCEDPDRFMAFYERNLKERGLTNGYNPDICRAVISACQKRQVGRMLVAIDDKGKFNAGIFTVWDKVSEYYLISTRRLDSDNGAMSLLIWHAIKHAAQNNIVFDLDGYCTPGDTQFFTRFGGVLKPRYCVQRSSVAFRIVSKFLKDP